MKEICQCKTGISVWREFHRMGQKGEQRTSYVKNGGGGVRFLPTSSTHPQSENLSNWI